MVKRLEYDGNALAALCRRYRIRRLALFGSVLQGKARYKSDIDFLVTFEPGAVPGMLGMAAIEAELSELFGRRVDLRTAEELSPYFRAAVEDMAEVHFAA
ncbi:MAG: nucleotidyltransferase family protein [Alphaproteobacteria bacterium]